MWTDWNFWLSVITVIVALIALWQTQKQIHLSNKQHLFDKRVEYYLIAKGLKQLYEKNQSQLKFKEDTSVMALDLIFVWMTNNTYLEKLADVIKHPLKQPYHSVFLVKMEELKNVSTKIRFTFNGKSAIYFERYVLCYQDLLFNMYQYQILFERMRTYAEDNEATPEETKQKFDEKKYREGLQKAVENLKQAYDTIKKENAEKKIEKQIKLK